MKGQKLGVEGDAKIYSLQKRRFTDAMDMNVGKLWKMVMDRDERRWKGFGGK